MLNVMYHKTFKESGLKKCVADDIYIQELDYVEWFPTPDLISNHDVKTIILDADCPINKKVGRKSKKVDNNKIGVDS